MDWRLSWLEAELTTNYVYIRKLVKICDQLLGPCRPSNCPALAGNMEPCSMSCHSLWKIDAKKYLQYTSMQYRYHWLMSFFVTSANIRWHLPFFWKKFNSNRFENHLHSIQSWRGSVMVMRQPGAPAAWPSCVTSVWQWHMSGSRIWK